MEQSLLIHYYDLHSEIGTMRTFTYSNFSIFECEYLCALCSHVLLHRVNQSHGRSRAGDTSAHR